ncbi:SH3 domain-containing protein [Cyanobium sp. WAJ14-Wanaka]|uniref:SH3 domain-containing protein n=1 Tax=Cyanobium sp. WAJ14-Wanaka TaxID=2823725 RepID=UPI0020CDA420|nr:SH3 domain-containing protein [Cyanobium sp. WAJ14-Wanaka]MCP9774260.1 SH3 domain-containing protein [Cyanobium sp. WAJ14-Wanaka]
MAHTIARSLMVSALGSALALSGAALPARAYWYGYGWGVEHPAGCWGGPCWNRPALVVSPAPVVVEPVINPAPGVIGAATICTNFQNVILRTGPNQNFAVEAVLANGTPINVLRNQLNGLGQAWSLVQVWGFQGFVPSGHICS